jgi:hypothetical protein
MAHLFMVTVKHAFELGGHHTMDNTTINPQIKIIAHPWEWADDDARCSAVNVAQQLVNDLHFCIRYAYALWSLGDEDKLTKHDVADATLVTEIVARVQSWARKRMPEGTMPKGEFLYAYPANVGINEDGSALVALATDAQ